MNPLQAFQALATALSPQARKVAYLVSLFLVCLVAAFMFFAVPEFLTVSWVKIEAALAIVAGVLNGVASANVETKPEASEYKGKHVKQD